MANEFLFYLLAAELVAVVFVVYFLEVAGDSGGVKSIGHLTLLLGVTCSHASLLYLLWTVLLFVREVFLARVSLFFFHVNTLSHVPIEAAVLAHVLLLSLRTLLTEGGFVRENFVGVGEDATLLNCVHFPCAQLHFFEVHLLLDDTGGLEYRLCFLITFVVTKARFSAGVVNGSLRVSLHLITGGLVVDSLVEELEVLRILLRSELLYSVGDLGKRTFTNLHAVELHSLLLLHHLF